MKKRIIALSLVLVIMVALTACGTTAANDAASTPQQGGSSASSVASTPGAEETMVNELALSTFDQTPNTVESDETLVVVMSAEPASLGSDPGSTNQTLHVKHFLCDRYLNYDTVAHEIKPGLFESWEWIDGTHLHVTLRKGVICYDGTEFVAEDVIFSMQMTVETSSTGFGNWFNIENCVIEDDYNLILEFKVQDPGVLYALTDDGMHVVDKSSWEANGSFDGNRTKPLYGTGPYRFVEWVPGQYILLERNEDYWDTSYVRYYKYIKFTFVTDTATRILAVQSGDANVALDVSIGQAIEFNDSDKVDMYAIEAEQVVGLWLNPNNPNNPDSPMKDVRVREAIRYAIDIAAVNQVLTAGYSSVQPFMFKTNSPYFSDPTHGEGYPAVNLEKAKQLLADAGYADGFTLSMPIQAEFEDAATAVQAMLSQIGIKVDVFIPDTGTLVGCLKGGIYDLCIPRHNSLAYFRCHSFFRPYEPAFAEVWFGGPKVKDPALQQMIDTAYQTLDEDEASKAIADIEQYMWDNVYYVGICSDICAGVCSEGLIGFRTLMLEHIDLRYVHPGA